MAYGHAFGEYNDFFGRPARKSRAGPDVWPRQKIFPHPLLSCLVFSASLILSLFFSFSGPFDNVSSFFVLLSSV